MNKVINNGPNIWGRTVYLYRGMFVTQHHSWRIGGWIGADPSQSPEVYVTPTGVSTSPYMFNRRRDVINAIDQLFGGKK